MQLDSTASMKGLVPIVLLLRNESVNFLVVRFKWKTNTRLCKSCGPEHVASILRNTNKAIRWEIVCFISLMISFVTVQTLQSSGSHAGTSTYLWECLQIYKNSWWAIPVNLGVGGEKVKNEYYFYRAFAVTCQNCKGIMSETNVKDIRLNVNSRFMFWKPD